MVDLRSDIFLSDPLDVLILQHQFFDQCRGPVQKSADEIVSRFPDNPYLSIAATAFVEKLGDNIPDPAIRAGVKSLAIREFARRGIATVPGV